MNGEKENGVKKLSNCSSSFCFVISEAYEMEKKRALLVIVLLESTTKHLARYYELKQSDLFYANPIKFLETRA